MFRSIYFFAFAVCTAQIASAGTPAISAADVSALVLPDLKVLSAVHHDGKTSNNGARVAHLDVDGVIAGSIHFDCCCPTIGTRSSPWAAAAGLWVRSRMPRALP